MTKAYCTECGRPVPQRLTPDGWQPGNCTKHPHAKRMSEKFVKNRFVELRLACGAPAYRPPVEIKPPVIVGNQFATPQMIEFMKGRADLAELNRRCA